MTELSSRSSRKAKEFIALERIAEMRKLLASCENNKKRRLQYQSAATVAINNRQNNSNVYDNYAINHPTLN